MSYGAAAASGDQDAANFIAAAGITDPAVAGPVNVYVTGLKDAGLWPKIHALHIIAGGTERAHKFNLKNPIDDDSAFRLSFIHTGGVTEITHAANGATIPSNVAAYVDTHLVPTNVYSTNNFSWGVWYGHCDAVSPRGYFGAASAGSSQWRLTRQAGDNTSVTVGGNTVTVAGAGVGFMSVTCTGDNQQARRFLNGAFIGQAGNSALRPNLSMYYGKTNALLQAIGTRLKFGFFGAHLTDGEMLTLYNLTAALQAALGR